MTSLESVTRCSDAGRIEALLATLRRARAHVPPTEVLDRTEILVPAATAFDQHAEALGRSFPAGKLLAFDLDDTVLNVSYTCGEEWQPQVNGELRASIAYDRMQRSLWRVAKYSWRLPRRFQYAPRRYPFLNNPQVFVQVRPGLLAALRGLKSAGVRLALVTASARSRVDFLLARLPHLRELFSEGDRLMVAAAEDVLAAGLTLYLHPEQHVAQSEIDALSLAVHAERPLSLAMKTPFLLKQILDVGDYDLLIDDSNTTATHLRAGGLGHKLLKIDPRQPQTPYVINILEAARRQLWNPQALPADVTRDGAEASGNEAEPSSYQVGTYAHLRFEDPLYYPLIHLSDRVELSHV